MLNLFCGGKMEFRQLGKNGIQVSALGLGCMGMSYAYGPADENESLQVLHRYLELGGISSTPPKSTARIKTKNCLDVSCATFRASPSSSPPSSPFGLVPPAPRPRIARR